MKFNKYYYENFSVNIPFDDSNPRYVMSLEGVDDILSAVVKVKPYTLSIDDFDNSQLVKKLINIDVFKEKHGKLALAIPVFIEKETDILKSLSYNVAKGIADILVEHKDKLYEIVDKIDNGFSKEINLYHILCGSIFDGYLFDYLEENLLVTTSKVHKSGLDYLIIIYECSKCLEQYSNGLLCSYNRLTNEKGGFISFGDSNGNRKDLYRYYRMKELNGLSDEQLEFVKYDTDILVDKFTKLVNGEPVEQKFIDIFDYFEYSKDGKICVPVYKDNLEELVEELYDFVIEIAGNEFSKALKHIEKCNGLLAVSHGVDIKDISNELYHLIFGEINEQLVRSKIVTAPQWHDGQGRYLKSFEICR